MSILKTGEKRDTSDVVEHRKCTLVNFTKIGCKAVIITLCLKLYKISNDINEKEDIISGYWSRKGYEVPLVLLRCAVNYVWENVSQTTKITETNFASFRPEEERQGISGILPIQSKLKRKKKRKQ